MEYAYRKAGNKDFYNQNAAVYDSSSWYQIHRGKVRALRDDLAIVSKMTPQNGLILELGVGSGFVAKTFLDLNGQVRYLGVDHSAAMLALAQKRLTEAGHATSVTLVQSEISVFLESTQDKFDVVIFHSILHHLDVYQEIVEKAFNKLSDGGLVFIRREPEFSHSHIPPAGGKATVNLLKLLDKWSYLLHRSGVTYRKKTKQPDTGPYAPFMNSGIDLGFLSDANCFPGLNMIWRYNYVPFLNLLAWEASNFGPVRRKVLPHFEKTFVSLCVQKSAVFE